MQADEHQKADDRRQPAGLRSSKRLPFQKFEFFFRLRAKPRFGPPNAVELFANLSNSKRQHESGERQPRPAHAGNRRVGENRRRFAYAAS